jgi:hypothetical protein
MILFLGANLTNFAWAQSGFYGAPDPLRVPQQTQPAQQQAVAPYAASTGSAPAGYSPQVAPYTVPNVYAQPTQYAPQQGYAPQPTLNQPAAYPSANPAYRTASAPRPAYIAQQPQPALAAPASPQPMPDPMPMYNEPLPQQNGSVTNQMLSEQGQTGTGNCDGYVSYNPTSGPCRTAVDQYQGAACSTEVATGCNSCPWYASLTGLALTRTKGNQLWTTYETNAIAEQILNTQQAESNWKFGGEIRFGRRFCTTSCDPCNANPASYWAIEANYWTIDPFDAFASVTNPNRDPQNPNAATSTVSTPLTTGYIFFTNPADTGPTRFDNAQEHRVWKRDELHSAEINLVFGQWANVCGSNWDFAFTVGPRFFRFEEELTFGSTTNYYMSGPNAIISWADPTKNAYLSDRITNNLWGAQIGCDLGYNLAWGNLRFFVTPKVGIYNNNVTSYFQAQLGDGTQGQVQAGMGGPFPVNASTNTFSVLSQIDVGAEWFFYRGWSARFGYRVVSISGIGLADNQFPNFINDTAAIANINTNGDLILHGAFATLTYNF